jgi:hypothetical protein
MIFYEEYHYNLVARIIMNNIKAAWRKHELVIPLRKSQRKQHGKAKEISEISILVAANIVKSSYFFPNLEHVPLSGL